MWLIKLLPGTRHKNSGSRFFLVFLLAFFLSSASSLFAQNQLPPSGPQNQYSEMTAPQLMQVIDEKDKLLAEWLTWQEQEKISQAELVLAWEAKLASRDKLIRDQGFVIEGYKTQKALGWVERILWGVGGVGVGYTVRALTAK